jgi:putative ABC transport system substrate-binding protein
LPY